MSRLENSRDAVRASLKSSIQEWLSHWQQVSNYIIIYAVALECDMVWIIPFAKTPVDGLKWLLVYRYFKFSMGYLGPFICAQPAPIVMSGKVFNPV